MSSAQIQEWVKRADALKVTNPKQVEGPLAELDAHLTLRSYIVGYTLSEADTAVWTTLKANHPVTSAFIKSGRMVNVARWFNFIGETAQPAIDLPSRGKRAAEDEGPNYDIDLPDAKNGVVTRFPPEPSGYLHIGHAKAAYLNYYFAHVKYDGKMIVRFDDTNPSKEKEEYQDAILEDCHLLGVKYDQITYTSDYFQHLYEQCVRMIKEGKAYADNTPQEQLRKEREARIESSHRNSSVEDSLAHFEEMKAGTEEGTKWFIRAKMDMASNNGAMRDPVIYRCNPQPHHRTGSTWKVYPTYDFACPIVDSLEGITHALRTTEYNDRDAQYQWFLNALELRKVYNWNFSRMNFIRTLLSKRKLTKLVDSGRIWGWDDPRMATVRGIVRRGMQVPALQEFILKQGPSKNINLMDWTSFWATNKKHIDPIAKRYTAVEAKDKVVCTIIGGPASPRTEEKDFHAKNASLGKKQVTYSNEILMDQADAQSFAIDEEITLMNWGNAIVRSKGTTNPILHPSELLKSPASKTITTLELELHLQGDVKSTSKKVTWLSTSQSLIPLTLFDFDLLITKDKMAEEDTLEDVLTPETEFRTQALGDANVASLPVGAVVQFDRKGFYRIDRAYEGGEEGEGVWAFQIPTGKRA